MFNPTRDQVRHFFCQVWQKHQEKQILAGAETTVIDIIMRHPEYHTLLENPEKAVQKNWHPEQGETNPFLHLSLHLAIREQIDIDQPPGIRSCWQRLLKRHSPHQAEHLILECLAETIWHAQRQGSDLNAAHYLEKLNDRINQLCV